MMIRCHRLCGPWRTDRCRHGWLSSRQKASRTQSRGSNGSYQEKSAALTCCSDVLQLLPRSPYLQTYIGIIWQLGCFFCQLRAFFANIKSVILATGTDGHYKRINQSVGQEICDGSGALGQHCRPAAAVIEGKNDRTPIILSVKYRFA